jgi:hypothetical protein
MQPTWRVWWDRQAALSAHVAVTPLHPERPADIQSGPRPRAREENLASTLERAGRRPQPGKASQHPHTSLRALSKTSVRGSGVERCLRNPKRPVEILFGERFLYFNNSIRQRGCGRSLQGAHRHPGKRVMNANSQQAVPILLADLPAVTLSNCELCASAYRYRMLVRRKRMACTPGAAGYLLRSAPAVARKPRWENLC